MFVFPKRRTDYISGYLSSEIPDEKYIKSGKIKIESFDKLFIARLNLMSSNMTHIFVLKNC